jgi:hypothetical protein
MTNSVRSRGRCRRSKGFTVLPQISVSPYRETQFHPYDPCSLDKNVYRKTRAGHQEIDNRQVLRRAELRRLLILIDGRRSPDELARCVRSSELNAAIENLVALGLIEPVAAPSFAAIGVSEALSAQVSLTPRQLDAARSAAAFAASELIGQGADPYCAMLLACEDAGTLRSLVSILQTKIRATAGEDAATMFVESIRDAATIVA